MGHHSQQERTIQRQSIINQRKVDLALLSTMEQQKLHLSLHLKQKKILDKIYEINKAY